MVVQRWMLLVAFLLSLVGERAVADAPPAECSIAAVDLECEHLVDPLGIDVVRPQLSWRITATEPQRRALRQTAYQILVASRAEDLDRDAADLWDSGKQETQSTQHIEYNGAPLEPGMACYWKVKVWDQEGVASDWSQPAQWTMGPTAGGEWTAPWIGAAEAKPESGNAWDPWFRKRLTIEGDVQRAELQVASVGYHELYVNGQRISDTVLAPAVSNHRKRARYVTYDIAPALQPGENVIALWLGTGWLIYPAYQTDDKPAQPIVSAEGSIDLAGQSAVEVRTDETWLTHPSSNKLIGTWKFRDFGGELQDTTREVPNWNQLDFDDTAWQPATVYTPKLAISAEMVEPNRVIESIEPVEVVEVNEGEYRVDMGRNFVGLIEVDVEAPPGGSVEILSSEMLASPCTWSLRNTLVVGPSGQGTFRSRFNYHSGRWLTIRGANRKPELADVRGYLVRSDFGRTGQFESSNELLNDIYDTTLWTLENLALGGYLVDCPQRERMGYGGDGHATINTALTNYDAAAFYTKWNQDWHDVQYDSGYLPYTAPTYWGGGGPGWSGFCVVLPWETFRQYGDRRILEQSWPTIERWLGFLEAHSEDDMLVRWKSQGDGIADQWAFLSDWLWPGADGTNSGTRETLMFNNAYWLYNLKLAAAIADELGKSDEAAALRQRARTIRDAVHAEFYDADDHSYAGGMQAHMALALLADLPPEAERPLVMDRLEREITEVRDGHIHAGITGGAMLFKLLMREQRDDLIATMATQTDFPSWGYMLDNGATTIWECWEPESGRPGHSKLHSSYLYVGAWPIMGLAGIRPGEEPGFAAFEIRPGIIDGLDWVKASYDGPTGHIESSWRKQDGEVELTVVVPPNTTARIYLPTSGKLTESGKALDQAEGLTNVRRSEETTLLDVASGTYEFRWPVD